MYLTILYHISERDISDGRKRFGERADACYNTAMRELLVLSLVEGYSGLNEDALQREEEKVKAEINLAQMKLDALEKVRKEKNSLHQG